VTCSDSGAHEPNQIATALKNGTALTVTCPGGVTWYVDTCGPGVELTVGGPTCSCTGPAAHTVRPCMGTADWGGVNTNSCNAPSQTVTVIFQF